MHTRIDIDVNSARAICEQFRLVSVQVFGVANNVTAIATSVDEKILSRNGLSTKLRNVRIEIERIETELLRIHRTTIQSINNYENLERRLRSSVDNLPTI